LGLPERIRFFLPSTTFGYISVMIVLCFFMMRGRRGSMMCGFGSHGVDNDRAQPSGSAKAILDRRYAQGEIDRTEYEEKRKALAGEHDVHTG